jgi:dihydroflavonol-4-reductase
MSTPSSVLLTGATGHLGAAIAAALLDRSDQYRLRLYIRSEEKLHALAASDERLAGLSETDRVVGDIRDAPALSNALKGVDIVIHACHSHEYWQGPDYLYDVNVGGTRALTSALTQADSPRQIVYIGSYSAHRALQPELPGGLCSSISARECSSISKPLSQRLLWDTAQDKGLGLQIVSPGYMIGPYQLNPTYFGALFHAVLFGPLRWSPPNSLNIVDVRDVALAVLDCLGNRSAPNWLLATGDNVPMQRLFAQMNHHAGFSTRPRPIAKSLLRLAPNLKQFGRFGQSYFTRDHTSALDSDLQNRSYDLSATVRDSIAWAKQHPLFGSRWEITRWLARRYLR